MIHLSRSDRTPSPRQPDNAPSTTAAVVGFLLLVVPGLAFELMRQRVRPPRPDSVFVEIARVVFVGITVSGLSLSLLSVVAVVRPTL